MTEPHKDFLALTHGEEWVNFYESFDKLVQDNLARSSDLLKKAMTLPEVADREVAKVKAEHEARLADERNRQRATLSGLRDEVAGTHQQISGLTRNMASVMADLERLTGRITTALSSIESAQPEARPQTSPLVETKPQTAPLADTKPQTASLSPMAAEEPVVEIAPGPEPASQATPEPMVAQAAPAEEPSSIDLSAMAAAEGSPTPEAPAAPAVPTMPGTSELAGATNGVGERQRPHWLSVTRIGSSGTN